MNLMGITSIQRVLDGLNRLKGLGQLRLIMLIRLRLSGLFHTKNEFGSFKEIRRQHGTSRLVPCSARRLSLILETSSDAAGTWWVYTRGRWMVERALMIISLLLALAAMFLFIKELIHQLRQVGA